MLKSPKTNTLGDELIESTRSMLNEKSSNTVHKDKEGNSKRIKK